MRARFFAPMCTPTHARPHTHARPQTHTHTDRSLDPLLRMLRMLTGLEKLSKQKGTIGCQQCASEAHSFCCKPSHRGSRRLASPAKSAWPVVCSVQGLRWGWTCHSENIVGFFDGRYAMPRRAMSAWIWIKNATVRTAASDIDDASTSFFVISRTRMRSGSYTSTRILTVSIKIPRKGKRGQSSMCCPATIVMFSCTSCANVSTARIAPYTVSLTILVSGAAISIS